MNARVIRELKHLFYEKNVEGAQVIQPKEEKALTTHCWPSVHKKKGL